MHHPPEMRRVTLTQSWLLLQLKGAAFWVAGLHTFLLLPKKWKLVQYLGGGVRRGGRGVCLLFFCGMAALVPPLPHTAADREIKVCAQGRQPNIFCFQKTRCRPFSAFLSKQNCHKAETHFWDFQFWTGFKCKTVAVRQFPFSETKPRAAEPPL